MSVFGVWMVPSCGLLFLRVFIGIRSFKGYEEFKEAFVDA
jgi:hypothetical protein